VNESSIIRRRILDIAYKSQASHIGACLSVVEMLLSIYGNIDLLKIRNKVDDRDRVIVSKGHSAAALYVVLNYVGLLSDKELGTYYQNNSILGGHVSSAVIAVEHSTGALGHGLPVAVGISIGLISKKMGSNVYVLVGDGELHEGTNWEAIHLAGHLGLNNLCLLIDYNGLSGIGRINDCCSIEPLKERLESNGFETHERDGHDQGGIDFTLQLQKLRGTGHPMAIICHTVKGKGVSFMENNNTWHYKSLGKEDYEKAILEIGNR